MSSNGLYEGGVSISLDELTAKLGYSYKSAETLALAFTHSTYASEARLPESNERLEFLGDSVLNISITKRLYAAFPTEPEGALSRRRQAVISNRNLAAAARKLELEKCLRLGQGQRDEEGYPPDSILADSLEALIGSLYLDGQFEAVEQVFGESFDGWVAESNPYGDPKSQLQERCHQLGLTAPHYALLREEGPDHAKQYTWEVVVSDKRAIATQTSKTKAQREAAALMLEQLETT